MPIFRRSKQPAPPEENAVITHLSLTDNRFGTEEERHAIHDLEARISAAVEAIGGDHDGHEFGEGEAILYTYGPHADQLFAAIRECLAGFMIRPGAYAIKRYGRADNPSSREEQVEL